MKKSFRYYAIIWAILFVVFNVVVFSVPSVIPAYPVKYDARFWIAWALIIVSFSVNLLCAYLAFRSDSLQKLFYKLPLITFSWSALIATLVIGVALILIPNYPVWIASVVSSLVIAFQVIAIVKIYWGSTLVQIIDESTKVQTYFIRNMTAEAGILVKHAKNDTIKAECKKVYEAFRYSDPRSCNQTSAIETDLMAKMSALTKAVEADDLMTTQSEAFEILVSLKERNSICKRSK